MKTTRLQVTENGFCKWFKIYTVHYYCLDRLKDKNETEIRFSNKKTAEKFAFTRDNSYITEDIVFVSR